MRFFSYLPVSASDVNTGNKPPRAEAGTNSVLGTVNFYHQTDTVYHKETEVITKLNHGSYTSRNVSRTDLDSIYFLHFTPEDP